MKRKKMITPVSILLLVTCASASIVDFVQLEIDFTDSISAESMAQWSEPGFIGITSEGLGWEGEPASVRDGWIRTEPLALGLSWRPPYGISVNITIRPEPKEILLNNGQITTPFPGNVYVRYSPDMASWSSWQLLQPGPASEDLERQPGTHFHGRIQVPLLERADYDSMLCEYAKLDVPWKSDEDAAVRWILEQIPDYFEDEQPFMGYVEFLWEGSFHGDRRIESFTAEVSYGMSGLHYPPDDPDIYDERDSYRWSYRAGS